MSRDLHNHPQESEKTTAGFSTRPVPNRFTGSGLPEGIDAKWIDLVPCFGQQDLQLHRIGILLLAELRSDDVTEQLYVESLTQILVIHLPRHHSTPTRPIPLQNGGLTHTQAQQVIDYIHTHLNRDLSLAELASVVNISPTYFASLFKQTMGTSPHQYVIQQRIEWAKAMLKKTDLAIRAAHRLSQRRHRFTGRFLQPKSFDTAV